MFRRGCGWCARCAALERGVGVAQASYCHPVEMLISNVLPLTGGMLFCNSHLFTGMSWAAFAVLGPLQVTTAALGMRRLKATQS